MSLTFEQLKPALYKYASKYSHKSNNRFDFWELINAVWAEGKVQGVSHVKLSWSVVKYRMIDYMRSETQYRARQKAIKKGRPLLYSMNFTSIMRDNEDEESWVERMYSASNNEQSRVDTNDWFDNLLTGFSRREKLIVKAMYINGANQIDIGTAIGVSNSFISLLHANIIKRLRAKLTKGLKA